MFILIAYLIITIPALFVVNSLMDLIFNKLKKQVKVRMKNNNIKKDYNLTRR